MAKSDAECQLDMIKALKELGAVAIEFAEPLYVDRVAKITFAAPQAAVVVRPQQPPQPKPEPVQLTPEDLKERLRRRELTGR